MNDAIDADGSTTSAGPDRSAEATPEPSRSTHILWLAIEWGLFAVWAADAALVMSKRPAGAFTWYAADLTMPAWIYVVSRRARGAGAPRWRRRLGSLPPAMLAALIFAGSAATEVSQYVSPRGPFAGVFDPLDIVAYATGIAVCWALDRVRAVPARE